MLSHFNANWQSVPIVVIDTETTGVAPGIDRACSIALVRFEQGKAVDWISSFIDPKRDIPPEASAIHGIVGSDVHGAPTIEEFFGAHRPRELLKGAQPCAYNAPFDREFVQREAFDDWNWPWLDPLVFVRRVDRFAKGKGRHTLIAACERHGVTLHGAHSAIHDARAAGELFFKIVPRALEEENLHPSTLELGRLILLQKRHEACDWFDFAAWRARKQDDAV